MRLTRCSMGGVLQEAVPHPLREAALVAADPEKRQHAVALYGAVERAGVSPERGFVALGPVRRSSPPPQPAAARAPVRARMAACLSSVATSAPRSGTAP